MEKCAYNGLIVVSHSSGVCKWTHCNLFCRETSFLY